MYNYIGIGTRCNSAVILRYKFRIDMPALPFDWIQPNVNLMVNVIDLYNTTNDTETYYTNLFRTIDKIKKITADRSWFPHDNFNDMSHVIMQYTRRTKRLFDLFDNNNLNIFLHINLYFEESNIQNLNKIIQSLNSKSIRHVIITINTFNYDYITANHINFYVPYTREMAHDVNFVAWDLLIINKLKTLKFFSECEYDDAWDTGKPWIHKNTNKVNNITISEHPNNIIINEPLNNVKIINNDKIINNNKMNKKKRIIYMKKMK